MDAWGSFPDLLTEAPGSPAGPLPARPADDGAVCGDGAAGGGGAAGVKARLAVAGWPAVTGRPSPPATPEGQLAWQVGVPAGGVPVPWKPNSVLPPDASCPL